MISDTIINGKQVAEKIFYELSEKISTLKYSPKLTIIQIGNNSSSNIYVQNKLSIAEKIGVNANLLKLHEDCDEREIIKHIEELNEKQIPTIVQLPLPNHLNVFKIINTIDHKIDVDGLTTINQGLLFNNNHNICPCTPLGIMTLLEKYNIQIEGKNVAIIGRSNLVGKPLLHMMIEKNATVTLCHSKTSDLKKITSQSDILVSAIGKPNFIKKDFIKNGAVVIDVGISYQDSKIFGDVDFDDVIDNVSMITPVPGGVGPMTVAMLMQNTVNFYLNKIIQS